jgi:hypothetical protein
MLGTDYNFEKHGLNFVSGQKMSFLCQKRAKTVGTRAMVPLFIFRIIYCVGLCLTVHCAYGMLDPI